MAVFVLGKNKKPLMPCSEKEHGYCLKKEGQWFISATHSRYVLKIGRATDKPIAFMY